MFIKAVESYSHTKNQNKISDIEPITKEIAGIINRKRIIRFMIVNIQ